MGRLIPAGTGMDYHRHMKIAGEDVVKEEIIADTDPAISEGIPGCDEDDRIQYGPSERGNAGRAGRVGSVKTLKAGEQSPAFFIVCRACSTARG
jgi:hypothetical protein